MVLLVRVLINIVSFLADCSDTQAKNEEHFKNLGSGILNYRTGELDDGTDPYAEKHRPYCQRFLSSADQIVVTKRDSACRRHRHVKTVAVNHFVEFVSRLEVAQLRISEHNSSFP